MLKHSDSHDKFHAIRGRAIQAYGHLEQSWCMLFAHLSGMNPHAASIVFFKITSSQARDKILSNLMKEKYNESYAEFFKSLISIFNRASQERNEIVHWNATITLGKDADLDNLQLRAPNLWGSSEKAYDSEDILAFTKRCSFTVRVCNTFTMFLHHATLPGKNEDEVRTWRDIFQQGLILPLESNHPLFPMFQES
jgi:hypothetical protein